jgi:hypothetical protein
MHQHGLKINASPPANQNVHRDDRAELSDELREQVAGYLYTYSRPLPYAERQIINAAATLVLGWSVQDEFLLEAAEEAELDDPAVRGCATGPQLQDFYVEHRIADADRLANELAIAQLCKSAGLLALVARLDAMTARRRVMR